MSFYWFIAVLLFYFYLIFSDFPVFIPLRYSVRYVRYAPYIPNLSMTFIMKRIWIVVKSLFSFNKVIICLCLLMCLYGGSYSLTHDSWTISITLRWSLIDHDRWSFSCVFLLICKFFESLCIYNPYRNWSVILLYFLIQTDR